MECALGVLRSRIYRWIVIERAARAFQIQAAALNSVSITDIMNQELRVHRQDGTMDAAFLHTLARLCEYLGGGE